MMFDQDFAISLWVETTRKIVCIQNHSPRSIRKDKTPEEAFTRINPDVSHFRVFSCLVYIHVRKDKRSKLKPSGIKGIFLGYNESSKAYKVYIPGQRKIEVSQDVTFHEEATLKKSKELQLETENEPTSPFAKSSGSGSQRERNQDDPMDQELSLEPAEFLEKSL